MAGGARHGHYLKHIEVLAGAMRIVLAALIVRDSRGALLIREQRLHALRTARLLDLRSRVDDLFFCHRRCCVGVNLRVRSRGAKERGEPVRGRGRRVATPDVSRGRVISGARPSRRCMRSMEHWTTKGSQAAGNGETYSLRNFSLWGTYQTIRALVVCGLPWIGLTRAGQFLIPTRSLASE